MLNKLVKIFRYIAVKWLNCKVPCVLPQLPEKMFPICLTFSDLIADLWVNLLCSQKTGRLKGQVAAELIHYWKLMENSSRLFRRSKLLWIYIYVRVASKQIYFMIRLWQLQANRILIYDFLMPTKKINLHSFTVKRIMILFCFLHLFNQLLKRVRESQINNSNN